VFELEPFYEQSPDIVAAFEKSAVLGSGCAAAVSAHAIVAPSEGGSRPLILHGFF
jgi:hypothetical protein